MKLTLNYTETINPGPKAWTVFTEVNTKKQIAFQGGDESWTWNIKTDSDFLKKHQNKIVGKYVEQGIRQHEYKGGFMEAISILEIKIK